MDQKKSDEYVKNKGQKCPFCGGRDLDGGSVDIDGGYACQKVSCNNCDEEWRDVYQLVSAHQH